MSSLVTYVLQVSLTLLAFGAIAAALVRFGRRPSQRRAGPLELVARLHLEGRRVVYMVRAGDRVLVVGGSEAGLTRLAEMDGNGSTDGRPKPPTSPANGAAGSDEPRSETFGGALGR